MVTPTAVGKAACSLTAAGTTRAAKAHAGRLPSNVTGTQFVVTNTIKIIAITMEIQTLISPAKTAHNTSTVTANMELVVAHLETR